MGYKEAAIKLWDIIDDIDTYSDMAKENDNAFRRAVEQKVKERFKIFTSDGYSLFTQSGCRVDKSHSYIEKQPLPTRLRELVEEMRECADELQGNGNEVEATMLRRWSGYVENYAIGIAAELEKEVNR